MVGSGNTWDVTAGSVVDGDTFHMNYNYTSTVTCNGFVDAAIQSDGSMTGTWNDNCYGTRSGPWTVGAGAAKAIPVTYNYSFDTFDNGMNGLWAKDHFKSTVTITPIGGSCYEVVRVDGGTFEGIDGAPSPGGDGTTFVGAGTVGTVSGGITMNICGTLNPSPDTSFEDLTIGGTYPSYAHKYFHRFFSSITSSTWGDWGWTFSTCANGVWKDNNDTETLYGTVGPNGEMGDIKGIYVDCQALKNQCKKGGWSGSTYSRFGFTNQGDCVSFFNKTVFNALDSLYYNGPTNTSPLYATGPFNFTWDPFTGHINGGYYNEEYPVGSGHIYYNVVTGGTVTGNSVYLTFHRYLDGYNFTSSGILSGDTYVGTLAGPFYFTATAN